MAEHRNIVQAEFFHVSDMAALEKRTTEYIESLADRIALIAQGVESEAATDMLDELGPNIKTVVRFYDEGGALTQAVCYFAQRVAWKAEIERVFLEEKGLRRWFLNVRHRRLAGRLTALRKLHKTLVVRRLQTIARTTREIALERLPKRMFRYVRDEELHELLEAVSQAHYVWLFVFPPGDLLAKKQEPIVTAM